MEWNKKEHVYLASADNYLGFQLFFAKHRVRQCEHFYSVVGGMGGFNLLPHLHELQSITFFDPNIHTFKVLDLHRNLIAISDSLDDYVSNVFCRPFQLAIHKDNAFLEQPFSQDIYDSLRERLSSENFETFAYYYRPYLTNPLVPIEGPSYHCSRILAFFEPQFLTTQMTHAIFKRDPRSINALFVGKGWLESDATFQAVRTRLANVPISYETKIAEDLTYRPHSGVYGSNIWNTDPSEQYSGYKRFISKVDWLIAFDDYKWTKDYMQVQYYRNDPKPPAVRFGHGNGNPHATCCMALDSFASLNTESFLEVIEPHPTEGMNYGFRFYAGQRRISVEDFLQTPCSVSILMIHILLGAGVPYAKWIAILEKARRESKRLVIVEHRKECKDFATREWDVHTENLIDEASLDEAVYSISCRFTKLACANLRGDVRDPRNLIYYL